MTAAAAYTVGAMLLTFATLHIIAAAITAHSVAAHAASAETAAPSATFPSLNKADPNRLKAEAAAPEPHAIGFVVGMLFLFVLATLFSAGVLLAYTGTAKLLVAAVLLASALLGVARGVHDGKRRSKEAVKGTMNMYIRAYFIALFMFSIARLVLKTIS